jgi:hypothetical protein
MTDGSSLSKEIHHEHNAEDEFLDGNQVVVGMQTKLA